MNLNKSLTNFYSYNILIRFNVNKWLNEKEKFIEIESDSSPEIQTNSSDSTKKTDKTVADEPTIKSDTEETERIQFTVHFELNFFLISFSNTLKAKKLVVHENRGILKIFINFYFI